MMMRFIRQSLVRRLAVAWIVTLAMAAGAFAPALQALQIAEAGPGHEICSAVGTVSAGGHSSPGSGSAAGSSHCPWCLFHTVAGMPPTEPLPWRGGIAVSSLPAPPVARPHWSATPRYAAPRGPPLHG
ncbi:DUF2946 family protein [Ideonella sp. A 288]|uniref:DUF2946 family protein n=1 Tax=Ideonella sp. A 288 TaxID=1962181 RepID=UPI000B4AF31E|nr:DUF2946 family protein [Ideonella sp. A 288]